MNSLPLTISILLLITGLSLALQCYDEITENNEKPTKSIECNEQFCSKSVLEKGNKTINSFRCDNMNRCREEGCHVDEYGVVVCCCKKNLCNSSSRNTMLFAVVPIVLLKFLA
ncbi:hypothetical protein ANCCAN_05805 [Ancylostoma caninum]|uniref:ET module n=1 Tax=Ancylostoma caninum TaxID=29170 RepID=A0A368GYQ1_ANCCA|nr:hypothetical protein ANCCAN_05805 [Ancylostoma caninum]